MAWIRQIPSGLWAATVRTPAGRITDSDISKAVITSWAHDLETDVRRDAFIDPRPARRITVGQWRERCKGGRHQELASRKRDESHWHCHVEPRWGRIPLGTILKPDVSSWVVEMETSHRDDCVNKNCPGCRVGAATVEGSVGVLRGLLDQAIDAKILVVNPARGVKTAPRDAHVDRVLDADEEGLLLARAEQLFGGRVDGRLFIELILETGMRWEEAAAIPPELVDTRRRRIHIAWVMERNGTCRPYAKSEAGNRTVAYDDHLAPRIAAAKLAAPVIADVFPERGPTRLMFWSPGGGGRDKRKRGVPGVLRYTNWRDRVWLRVLRHEVPDPSVEPKPPGVSGPKRRPVRLTHYLDDPQPTPHDLRHTHGTRLADEGVPIHDLMKLMGHKDMRSAQRYMHSSEKRFERARQALRRARQALRRSRGQGESGTTDHGATGS